MKSILKSVEWGKSALSLLDQMKNLNPSKPAVMHIRHSAREQMGYDGVLSEEGKQAAYEFGTRISSKRKTKLYHTVRDRSKETAQEIHRALSDRGIESTVIGALNIISIYNPGSDRVQGVRSPEWLNAYVFKQNSPVKTSFLRWISGNYSPLEIRPSLDFVQHVTGVMVKNIESSDPSGLDIYVSHDTWIAAFLFHWFGIIPVTWIKYLDGFFIQTNEKTIKLLTPNESKEIRYPYWWKNLT
jgi:hypothetical protein